MKVTNLIIPVGIPGSGKSTWAKEMLGGHYAIVSSDQIRKRLFGSLRAAHDVSPEQKKENNDRVWHEFYRNIDVDLQHNISVVADATNLQSYAREKLREIAERHQYTKTHVVIFDNIPQAIYRNNSREADAVVPQEVMDNFTVQFGQAKAIIVNEEEPYDSVTRITSVF